MGELLLELLSEEIPARMQSRAIADLTSLVRDKLIAAEIPATDIRSYVTPRRLTVIADGIPARQPDQREEQLPPPGSADSVTSAMRSEPDHGEESYRGSDRLADRVAVVTGADSGIGRAVALAFAREGADVVLCYLEGEEDDGKEAARLVEEAGRRSVRVPTDLTDEEACNALDAFVREEFGEVSAAETASLGRVAAYGARAVRGRLVEVCPWWRRPGSG